MLYSGDGHSIGNQLHFNKNNFLIQFKKKKKRKERNHITTSGPLPRGPGFNTEGQPLSHPCGCVFLPPPSLSYSFFKTTSPGETSSRSPGAGSFQGISVDLLEELHWGSTPEKCSLSYFQAFPLLIENLFSPQNTRKRKEGEKGFVMEGAG